MNKILSIYDSDGPRRSAAGRGYNANLKPGERPNHAPSGRAIAAIVVIFGLISLAGCVTKATADAEARKAFVAGEKAAYQSIQSAATVITVLGDVQKHQIPWVDGLTLAQALATAHYTGAHDPTNIILRRNSVQTEIDPKKLLNGQDIPLKPGDVISIIGQ
ncbi:MAG: hypothetical protein ACRED1_05765 [Limisphaerales bacterium]